MAVAETVEMTEAAAVVVLTRRLVRLVSILSIGSWSGQVLLLPQL